MADTAFDIKSDSPVNGDLMFWSIVGHEGLSRPSFYELTVLSSDRQIDPKDILGKAFNVGAYFMDAQDEAHERHFQGHAVRIVRGGPVGSRYFQYHISLRSWFWLLTRRTNARIYQEKTVLEVADAVFEDSPIKRFKKTNVDNVTGKHNPRRYCVQHAESDYQFLSHLLEDEGIYYWFDGHDKPGTMYLSDSSDIAHAELPAQGTLHYTRDGSGNGRFNEIVRWVSADRLDTGHHAGSDSNFKTIRKKIGATINAAEEHDLADFEMFESPAGYFNTEDAEARAKIRGDELAARRQRHWAVTGWPDVAAGSTFTFEGDPDGICDGDYLIAGCTFVMSHPGYEGVNSNASSVSIMKVLHEALNDDAINVQTLDTIEYIVETTANLRTGVRGASSFLLTVIPADLPYRPARLTPGVVMPGPQSAIVVGAAGKEIDVDDFGRVKVQFHWDRYGTNDDKSTAWVRVSQPWAGKGWGGYFTPRIGQEVIVDFLNGDPDRPVITGRLYNNEQPIPYKASGTQSGFKTRSTPGGTPANFNEIMFEDKKGAENINIHAERNMSRSVEVDDSTTVGNDQSDTIERDRTALVKRNETCTVAEKQVNVVGIRQENTIGSGGQKTQVGGFQENIYHAGQKTSVVGMQNLIVTANQDHAIGGFQHTVVGKNMDVGVVGYQTTSVGIDSALLVTGNTKIQTGGVRNDVTSGKHAIMANQIKLVSNSTLDMMAVGDINATSIGSNTTVLGSNSSGYIGSNSEANLGITRSTFMGLSLSNALALDISNFLGIQIANTASISMSNTAVLDLTAQPLQIDQAALKIITSGAGAAGGGGAAVAGAIVAGVLGAAGVIRGAFDVAATMEQYQNAAAQLAQAAAEAEAQGLTGLASRLTRMAAITNRRRTEGIAMAVGGPLALTGAAIAEMTGGTAATSRSKALSDAGGPEGTSGAAPAAPAAPPAPAVPAMPPPPPPYKPPAGAS